MTDQSYGLPPLGRGSSALCETSPSGVPAGETWHNLNFVKECLECQAIRYRGPCGFVFGMVSPELRHALETEAVGKTFANTLGRAQGAERTGEFSSQESVGHHIGNYSRLGDSRQGKFVGVTGFIAAPAGSYSVWCPEWHILKE